MSFSRVEGMTGAAASAALDSLDPDLAKVDKAELGDWACENYSLIRFALMQLTGPARRELAAPTRKLDDLLRLDRHVVDQTGSLRTS